jgi:hypothetical protein
MSGSFNGNYSNLAVREFALPLVVRTLGAAAEGASFARTLETGEPIRLAVPNPAQVRAVQFDIDGRELGTLPSPGPVALLLAGSPFSGLCRALVVGQGDPQWEWFGIQGPRMDSDLTPMPETDRDRIVQKHGLVPVTGWPELEAELLRTRSGNEWHHWLLIALLAALAGEMLLQRRFV